MDAKWQAKKINRNSKKHKYVKMLKNTESTIPIMDANAMGFIHLNIHP